MKYIYKKKKHNVGIIEIKNSYFLQRKKILVCIYLCIHVKNEKKKPKVYITYL